MTKKTKIIISAVSVVIVLSMLTAAVLSLVGMINLAVVIEGGNIKEDFSEGEYDCILVLGAGLRSDRTPSDMLEDRLKVAIELYWRGVADIIVLSGDKDIEADYDEVAAMEKYCLENGIPSTAIVKDIYGFSTYESMQNLVAMSEYDRVVIVTQRYHLYRAVFIAEKLGLCADGADAALRTYRGQLYRELREVAARIKDFALVTVKTK